MCLNKNILDAVKHFEWENFEGEYPVIDPGILHSETKKIKIFRDQNLNLVIEAAGSQGKNNTNIFKLNEGIHYSENIICTKIGNLQIKGYIKGLFVSRNSGDIKQEIIQHGTADEFFLSVNEGKIFYLTEWIANLVVPTDFVWPSNTTYKLAIQYLREHSINSQNDIKKISILEKKIDFLPGGSRNCIEFSYSKGPSKCKIKIILGMANEQVANRSICPGFITYFFNDELELEGEVRDEIRSALSFAFGRYFVYLGYAAYDKDWNLTKQCAKNGYVPLGMERIKAVNFFPMPIYTNQLYKQLDSEKLNKIVEGYVSVSATYDLKYIMWLYWHVQWSPHYSTPTQFGTIIEALINKHLKIHDANKILGSKFSELHEKLKEVCDAFSASEEINMIKNKLSNLNYLPLGERIKKFSELNSLDVSESEVKVIKSRNACAHGSFKTGDIELIKHNYILFTLCNKIILTLIAGSEDYIDYGSSDQCIKKLRKPCL